MAGFTLVELVVTLAALLILITVGIPQVSSFIGNNRATAQTNEFVTSLNLARSETVKRGIPVSLCSSSDQATCAESTDWANGWIIFSDESGTSGTLDATDVLIHAHEALAGNSSFTTSVTSIRYRETGTLATASNITFSLSPPDCKANQKRSITIRPQGYSTVQKNACS